MDDGINQLHPPGHHFSNTTACLANLVSCLCWSLCLISSFLFLRTQLKCNLLWRSPWPSPERTYGSFSFVPKVFIHILQGHIVMLSPSCVSVSSSKLAAPRVIAHRVHVLIPVPNKCLLQGQTDGQKQRCQGIQRGHCSEREFSSTGGRVVAQIMRQTIL